MHGSELTGLPQGLFSIRQTEYRFETEAEPLHLHRWHEIVYVAEGTVRFFVENTSFLVNAGGVVTIGENQLHRAVALGKSPTRWITVAFCETYLQELQQAFTAQTLCQCFSRQHVAAPRILPVWRQTRPLALLRELLDLSQDPGREADMLRKTLLASLLLILQRLHRQPDAPPVTGRRAPERLADQVQQYLSLHSAERFSLQELARRFHVSPCYLSRLFRQNFQIGIVDYLNGIRIKAAQALLEQTQDGVAEIARRTGFATTAHFRRVFKQATGYPPQQYRLLYGPPAESEQ